MKKKELKNIQCLIIKKLKLAEWQHNYWLTFPKTDRQTSIVDYLSLYTIWNQGFDLDELALHLLFPGT